MVVLALLTVRSDQLDAFRRYEHAAAAIMAIHGGGIEHAYVLVPSPSGDHRELHVVRFPDTAAFDAYRADGELVALRPIRESCVIATEIWPATDGPRY